MDSYPWDMRDRKQEQKHRANGLNKSHIDHGKAQRKRRKKGRHVDTYKNTDFYEDES